MEDVGLDEDEDDDEVEDEDEDIRATIVVKKAELTCELAKEVEVARAWIAGLEVTLVWFVVTT
jgi:hypothetical protein